jgi:hypothetical protein
VSALLPPTISEQRYYFLFYAEAKKLGYLLLGGLLERFREAETDESEKRRT